MCKKNNNLKTEDNLTLVHLFLKRDLAKRAAEVTTNLTHSNNNK